MVSRFGVCLETSLYYQISFACYSAHVYLHVKISSRSVQWFSPESVTNKIICKFMIVSWNKYGILVCITLFYKD